MAKERFSRTKAHLNVGTIGHVDHGTTPAGVMDLPEGVERVMPGDNVQGEVDPIASLAMEEGLRFAVREGGRSAGAGVVAGILG